MDSLVTVGFTSEQIGWALSIAFKAALLLASAGVGALFLRRGSAAARHQIWTLGVVAVLALPLFCWALPSLPAPASTAGSSLIATAVLVSGASPIEVGPSWPSWLALCWVVGSLVVGLRFALGHLAAHRLWRGAEPAEAWRSALRDAATSLGLSSSVALRRSESVQSPMTLGALRPGVLLPAVAEQWSSQRLHAVLLHELAHVQRRDTLVQLGAQVVCALYWWNPLAWVAAARLRTEREYAADDRVLGTGVRPSSYAGDLLEVARRVCSNGMVGAVSMADPSGTEARLRRILDSAVARRPLGSFTRLGAWASAGLLTVSLAVSSLSASASGSRSEVLEERTAPVATVPASGASLTLGIPSTADIGERNDVEAAFLGVTWGIDMELVTKEVERHLGELKQCYERRLLVHPDLTGEVMIHWGISTEGEVIEQCITRDTVEDEEIRRCVNDLVLKGAYPSANGDPVDVTFPFVFSPSP